VPTIQPLVTIVTPCYNSAQFIEDTIQSVLAQTYPNIEYIVMDGGSTDGTQAIAERYAERLTLVSERDRGQTHAINKGWQRAKGDILAWLNADDLYYPETVEKAVTYLTTHPDVGWVYGYGHSLDINGQPMPFRHPVYAWDYQKLLNLGCYIVQPTVFLRRDVFQQSGPLTEELHYCMDYEYWLRIGRQYPAALVPEIRAGVKIFRATKSRSGGYKRIVEIEAMLRSYGASDLPAPMHHEWAMAALREGIHYLRSGRWTEGRKTLSQAGRYPHTLPRAIAKLLFNAVVPPRLETKIRRAWLHADVVS
jgi:glycosyltransferase involved in cell wall biosynthesis